jgi:hypothetical protein
MIGTLSRRTFLGTGLAGLSAVAASGHALAQTESLSELGASLMASPTVSVFTARDIITLDPAKPSAEAVAMVNGRIL